MKEREYYLKKTLNILYFLLTSSLGYVMRNCVHLCMNIMLYWISTSVGEPYSCCSKWMSKLTDLETRVLSVALVPFRRSSSSIGQHQKKNTGNVAPNFVRLRIVKIMLFVILTLAALLAILLVYRKLVQSEN
jgi:hypothetical protein